QPRAAVRALAPVLAWLARPGAAHLDGLPDVVAGAPALRPVPAAVDAAERLPVPTGDDAGAGPTTGPADTTDLLPESAARGDAQGRLPGPALAPGHAVGRLRRARLRRERSALPQAERVER